MAQDEELDVLGGGRATRQQDQPEHLPEEQVEQPQRHVGIMSDQRSLLVSDPDRLLAPHRAALAGVRGVDLLLTGRQAPVAAGVGIQAPAPLRSPDRRPAALVGGGRRRPPRACYRAALPSVIQGRAAASPLSVLDCR